jgi:hypothetical protein
MHNYYKLLSVGDVQKNETSIIGILQAMKKNELPNDLKLLNYFKEVPISFGAEIDNIDQGLVEMTVHQLQAVTMQQQEMTLIRSKYFEHDVLVKVLKVCTEKNFAFVSNFAYAQILSDRRKHVRVKLTDNFDVVFHSQKQSIKGSLKDISIGGVAIIAPENCGIEEDLSGVVNLNLSGTKLEVPGKVLRIHNEADSRYIVIQLEADGKNERAISQFVFQTQNEIIRELKDQII